MSDPMTERVRARMERLRARFQVWLGAHRGAVHWLWLSLSVLVVDQASKWLLMRHFELYDRIAVLPILDITRMHNTGAAFSMLADAGGWQRWFLILVAVLISIGILLWLRRLPPKGEGLLAAALALILGGALGNVLDRVIHGHVVDFLHFHLGGWYYPAFNVADAAITVGAVLVVVDSFVAWRRERRGDAGP